jgi:DNA-binding PadR family transcriptional regulator
MFDRHGRHGRHGWREGQEERGRDRERGPRGHHGPRGGHHGPHREGEHHFGPRRGGPPSRGFPPWGRGGPFGDDPFGEDEGGRRRHRRGDIKIALLELLAEQPRHGYELIKELGSRYGGFYRPSPGSVYPTLQLLEDEGHLVSETVDGKRVYTVTDSGRASLQERLQERPADHRGRGGLRPGETEGELHELREGAMALMAAVMQVARHGTVEQVREARARLDAARRDIYGILASGDDRGEPRE